MAKANCEKLFLSPPEAAKRYGVSPESIREKILSGEIHGINIGNGKLRPRLRVSLEALADWELRRSVITPTAAVRKPRRESTPKSFV